MSLNRPVPAHGVEASRPTTNGLLLYGILGGPLSFAVDLTWSYTQVPHDCSTGHHYMLHVVTAICALFCVAALIIAWRSVSQTKAAAGKDHESGRGRQRFMALLGVAASGFFLLVIIANAIPRFLMSPCE